MKNTKKPRRISALVKPKKSRKVTAEEVHVLTEAMRYCVRHFPMLWTTGAFPRSA